MLPEGCSITPSRLFFCGGASACARRTVKLVSPALAQLASATNSAWLGLGSGLWLGLGTRGVG